MDRESVVSGGEAEVVFESLFPLLFLPLPSSSSCVLVTGSSCVKTVSEELVPPDIDSRDAADVIALGTFVDNCKSSSEDNEDIVVEEEEGF